MERPGSAEVMKRRGHGPSDEQAGALKETVVGFLQNAIRSAVISAIGAKMARGRSPIVGALITLLLSRPRTEDG